MPLTAEQKTEIRRFVLTRAVPRPKAILETGGFVPEDMEDEEAYAEVEAVLKEVAAEIKPLIARPAGMTHTRILRLMQLYFDGYRAEAHEVVYHTGLPTAQAQEVADAIGQLQNMPFEQIEPARRDE